jgi:hypothetical protein
MHELSVDLSTTWHGLVNREPECAMSKISLQAAIIFKIILGCGLRSSHFCFDVCFTVQPELYQMHRPASWGDPRLESECATTRDESDDSQ